MNYDTYTMIDTYTYDTYAMVELTADAFPSIYQPCEQWDILCKATLGTNKFQSYWLFYIT